MRSYMILLVSACISFGVLIGNAHALFKMAKVTLVVVDEEGKPLEGADAGVGFEKNTGWGTEASAQRGLTDSNGRFTATGSCNGHIGYGARKDGYYRSHYDYDFKNLGTFGWKPWNPEFKIVMRKMENPIPMYARNTKFSKKSIALPITGKDVGFDLIVYDWVAPYGRGQHADFIFHLEKKYSSRNDYSGTLTLTFPSKFDGILKIEERTNVGSQFNLPRYAPEVGYQHELVMNTSQNPNGKWVEGYRQNDNYVFRIRSEVKNGKLIRAMYGKIRGPIQFEPRIDPTEIYFKYYLNPDYTRNLEFDPKRNLFDNLKDLEQVSEP